MLPVLNVKKLKMALWLYIKECPYSSEMHTNITRKKRAWYMQIVLKWFNEKICKFPHTLHTANVEANGKNNGWNRVKDVGQSLYYFSNNFYMNLKLIPKYRIENTERKKSSSYVNSKEAHISRIISKKMFLQKVHWVVWTNK